MMGLWNGCGKDEKVVEYYESGKIKSEENDTKGNGNDHSE